MAVNYYPVTQQPTVVKYVQMEHSGILPHNQLRHGVGFVLRGTKYIYSGDSRQQVNQYDLFYLCPGNHYMEDIPEDGKPFEQIMFYYTPEQLSAVLSQLSMTYGLNIDNDHKCPNCEEKNYVIYPSWNTIRIFFTTVNQYFSEGIFGQDKIAESLKITELIYLLASRKDCCLKTKMLENTDLQKESFEQLIHQNIFNNIPIEDLAQLCNRSLTSFKKEFKRHFFEPPHKWFIRQRLMHARLLIISTGKSIAEIGNECNIPNTSHFIKLFKKEYGVTPAVYRKRHIDDKKNENKVAEAAEKQLSKPKSKKKA